jgi:hypothetical protein
VPLFLESREGTAQSRTTSGLNPATVANLVAPVVRELAEKHGLVCFDLQESKVYLPVQLRPKRSRLRFWWNRIRLLMSGIGILAVVALIAQALALFAGGCPSDRVSEFIQNASWAVPKYSVPLEGRDRQRSYKIGVSFHSLCLGAAGACQRL